MNNNDRFAAIEAELAELKGTQPIRESKPYQPIDYTRNFSLDGETLRSLSAGVERVPGEIAREQSQPVQLPGVAGQSSGKAGSNFTEPRSLKVEGVEHCDRIADHFAALDKCR